MRESGTGTQISHVKFFRASAIKIVTEPPQRHRVCNRVVKRIGPFLQSVVIYCQVLVLVSLRGQANSS
jgi:hypothetical protein